MKFAGVGALVLTLVACAMAGGFGSAQAADSNEYEIAANDGYGLQECLEAGTECGHVVADAWCEAHGHGHAVSFGPRGALANGATRIAADEETYVVKCGD
jgi:hypothetical protein